MGILRCHTAGLYCALAICRLSLPPGRHHLRGLRHHTWPTLGRTILEMQATKGPKKWVWTYYPGHCWDCPSFVISKILTGLGANPKEAKSAADKIEKVLENEWRKRDIEGIIKSYLVQGTPIVAEAVDAIAREAEKWVAHVVERILPLDGDGHDIVAEPAAPRKSHSVFPVVFLRDRGRVPS